MKPGKRWMIVFHAYEIEFYAHRRLHTFSQLLHLYCELFWPVGALRLMLYTFLEFVIVSYVSLVPGQKR